MTAGESSARMIEFEQALLYAARCHRGQVRKGTEIPYIAHPLAVAGLVLEYGGSSTEAIAGLLHDVVEDCGGAPRQAEIALRFGPDVAAIVSECTDTDQTPKPPWRQRKEQYIAHLDTASRSALLVSACDKLHNARSIVSDLRALGATTWTKFNGGREGTLWYYQTLVQAFSGRGLTPRLLAALSESVDEMQRLSP